MTTDTQAAPAANGTQSRRSVSQGDAPSLSRVSKGTKSLPSRLILYGPEGMGKTSFAAQMSGNPIFLCTEGEDGVDMLINTGQIKETAHFADAARNFSDVLKAVDELVVLKHDHKTLVIDTLNGVQQLCFKEVCAKKFSGNQIEFDRWAAGAKASQEYWWELLVRLDRLREEKKMRIVLLAHAAAEKVPNPDGIDYDRWQPALDKKYLWPLTNRWADMILFCTMEVFSEKIDKADKKGKASGGDRLLYCQPTPTCVAKNRHGLPPTIPFGPDAPSAWGHFIGALKNVAEKKNAAANQEATTEEVAK